MGCVNKSGKEFKDLAAKHNLNSNALELIVHKYWLKTGNETVFPTDVYMQAQLGGGQYQESDNNVRELWKKDYGSTKEFRTLEECQSAYNEAARFFPKSAIVYYKNAKGNYMLSVKRPVKSLNNSKEDFFYELDNMAPTKSGKTFDLGIEKGKSYGIGKVQELYDRFNDDRTSRNLADRVFNLAKALGLNITFEESLPTTVLGRYSGNSIIYRKSFLENDSMNNLKAPVILHELLHAVSMYALSDRTDEGKLSESLRKFKTEMNSLYQDLKDNPMLKGERGVVNLNEFVAELANPSFRGKLQEIDKQNKTKENHKPFWSRVLDAFKRLLGLHVTNSYYERSMNALDKALNAFDIDTFMRYNQTKSTLREAVNNEKSIEDIKNEAKDTINNNNSRLENKNFMQYEQGIKSAGRVFEGAFNLLRNEYKGLGRSSKEKTSNNKSLREQLHEESSKQQKELIRWATKNSNLVVEPIDYFEEELGEHLEGSEATVWRNNGGKEVVKNITLNHYGSPLKLLNRILIHNMAFSSTVMKVDKVGTSDDGLSVVIKQPLIKDSGIAPTFKEIEDYMVNTLGFTLSKGKGTNAEYTKNGYMVSDIRPENVIKQPDGTLAVIDCYAQFLDDSALNPREANDFIQNLSDKELDAEVSLIKQESADFDLVNNTEEDTIKESINRSNNVNNNNVNNGTEYKQTDEFRRVQESSRKLSQEQISRMRERLSDDDKRRLGGLLGRQLDSASNGGWYNHRTSLTHVNEKKGLNSKFDIGDVNSSLFHDIFEIVRTYLKNGELVDLHDNYDDCKCFVTNDGLAGFAIEPDGNLVSVYSLNPKENGGFLYAIQDMIREEGATHLDAFESSMQPLQEIYSKTLGFHTASTMDYNMEYDHDDIAKNHGNPQVVFMVDHEVENPKHFDKDSYDAAKEYQMQQLKEEDKVEKPVFEEGKTYKVPLLSYEYFNDLYEDTTVDAEWKIPYLQKLDSQLTLELSDEEANNIINQMNTILNATSEEEVKQELEDPKKVKKTLSEYEKFIQQLDNLLEGGTEDFDELEIKRISASEIRHTAELIINEVSDEITRLQTEEGRAKEIFPFINTDLDFQTASRRQIVDAIGIDNLLDRVKNLFDSENAMYDDEDTSFQADLITDNWDAFVTMAADIFALNEGFGFVKEYSKGNFKTTDASKVDFDNFNDYDNDEDARGENEEKDEQEHWQMEMRTIDVLNSMSDLVRQGLRECYLLDENGEKMMSKWDIAERVNPRKATNSILRWTQGSMSLDDMVSKLSEKSKKNPWLTQLTDKLADKSGKYTDFQSQFYGVFSKHFQPYSIVLQENGKYHSMMVNSHPALTDAKRAIISQFKTQTHPMFMGNMVKGDALGSEDTIDEKDEFNLHKALHELREITNSLLQGNTLDDEMSKRASGNILGVCRLLGYPVTEDMVEDILNKETIKKETAYLGYIVKDLDKVYEEQLQGKRKNYGSLEKVCGYRSTIKILFCPFIKLNNG